MNELASLYTGFSGRISRRTYWSACGLMVVAQLLLAACLARVAGIGLAAFTHGDRWALVINLVVSAFFFWPSLALAVKRLHDRDLPGWWAALLHVLVFVVHAEQAFGKALIRDKSQLLWSMIPALLLIGFGTWLAMELLLWHGTPGPNQYGAPPADAPRERARTEMTPGE